FVGAWFQGTIILDPAGSGASIPTLTRSVFVVKLASNGAFVWGGVVGVPPTGAWATMGTLAVASDGSIHIGGSFYGEVDLDPGAGTASRTGGAAMTGVPVLLQLDNDGR